MKTASVRELRNRYGEVLRWVSAGEEVVITRRGKRIARLVPEAVDAGQMVDWSESRAVSRERDAAGMLGERERVQVLEEGSGRW